MEFERPIDRLHLRVSQIQERQITADAQVEDPIAVVLAIVTNRLIHCRVTITTEAFGHTESGKAPVDMMTAEPQPKSDPKDPYRLHRLALLPLRKPVCDVRTVEDIESAGLERFAAFLEANGLQQLWRDFLEQGELAAPLKSWYAALRDHARLTAAHQMFQNRAISDWAEGLARLGVDWFLFKGADLRGWLYSDPVMRPVSDIDLFVPEADREPVIRWAERAGYERLVDPATASHEATLSKGRVSIDLHWHLFRPGRARAGLDDWLFDHRKTRHGLPGLDATASLLVMLVHPAITKYLISPTSMLVHAVDQARLIESETVDWEMLSQALVRFGISTAAWSSLYLLRELSGIEAPGDLMSEIQPGAMKRYWLRQWIDRAWITRCFDHRWLVAGFFSLALQDGFMDVARAMRLRNRQLSGPS